MFWIHTRIHSQRNMPTLPSMRCPSRYHVIRQKKRQETKAVLLERGSFVSQSRAAKSRARFPTWKPTIIISAASKDNIRKSASYFSATFTSVIHEQKYVVADATCQHARLEIQTQSQSLPRSFSQSHFEQGLQWQLYAFLVLVRNEKKFDKAWSKTKQWWRFHWGKRQWS